MNNNEKQIALRKLVLMRSFEESESALNCACRLLLDPSYDTIGGIIKRIRSYGKFSLNPTSEASDKIFMFAFALDLCRKELGEAMATEAMNTALDIIEYDNTEIGDFCIYWLTKKRDRLSVFYKLIEHAKMYSSTVQVSDPTGEEKSIRRYELRVCSLRRKMTHNDKKWIADPDMLQGAIDVLLNSIFKSQRNYF